MKTAMNYLSEQRGKMIFLLVVLMSFSALNLVSEGSYVTVRLIEGRFSFTSPMRKRCSSLLEKKGLSYRCRIFFQLRIRELVNKSDNRGDSRCLTEEQMLLYSTSELTDVWSNTLYKFPDYLNEEDTNPFNFYMVTTDGLISRTNPEFGAKLKLEMKVFDVRDVTGVLGKPTVLDEFPPLYVPLVEVKEKSIINETVDGTAGDHSTMYKIEISYNRFNCFPQDDSCNGRYTCDSGEKICKPKFYGMQCTRFCDMSNDPYLGYSNCTKIGHLICQKNYFGRFCNHRCVRMESVKTAFSCGRSGERICDPGFRLDKLGRCRNKCDQSGNCKNGGECVSAFEGDKSCYCKPGFIGPRCGKAFCSPDYCSYHGSCKIEGNQPMCSCDYGYAGHRCQHSCESSDDCKNGGRCKTNVNGSRYCSCRPLFASRDCSYMNYTEPRDPFQPTLTNGIAFAIAVTYLLIVLVSTFLTPAVFLRKC